MNLAFGYSNQGVYAIGARSAPARSRLWGRLSPVGVEPALDFVGVEAQQPSELEVWNTALLRPSIERRTFDPETLRQCGDVEIVLHQNL